MLKGNEKIRAFIKRFRADTIFKKTFLIYTVFGAKLEREMKERQMEGEEISSEPDNGQEDVNIYMKILH
jgi:hypothetical protein